MAALPNIEVAAYWIPAFAGMTSEPVLRDRLRRIADGSPAELARAAVRSPNTSAAFLCSGTPSPAHGR
jgi:hypothetical protein